MATYDNDERIDATEQTSGEADVFLAERTKLAIVNATEAPLAETKLNVLLELTGTSDDIKSTGADIVVILDVSGSMRGEKLSKMKTATKFVIKKLGPPHRLCVVTFSTHANLVYPLRQVTEEFQADIGEKVDELIARGSTNTTDGIEMALKVLSDRRFTRGRSSGIMLMSDGEQDKGGDAANIAGITDVPVFTFGFGQGYDPEMLMEMAGNSNGGTFSDVSNMDDLSKAFSLCLAGLLTVAIQDLKLTVAPESDSKIGNVYAGNYLQSTSPDGSNTISFGTLYVKEMRKVLVELFLPQVKRRAGQDVLQVAYSYKNNKGEEFDSNPVFATIIRSDKITVVKERDEVTVELRRLQTAGLMKEARILADDNNLGDAKEKLNKAKSLLEAERVKNELIEMLKNEVQQLHDLMLSPEIYEKFGRAFALSSELSHDRQRLASRGDVEKLRLFATPIMNAFVEQALAFDKDPTMPLPKLEEDVKQVIANASPVLTQEEEALLVSLFEKAMKALRAMRQTTTK